MRFLLLFAAAVVALNGGLDNVVKATTVDTTTLADRTSTVEETETALPPPPPKESTTSTEFPLVEIKTHTPTEEPKDSTTEQETSQENNDTTKQKATSTKTTATSEDSGDTELNPQPITTTIYPLAPSTTLQPLVVTVYASELSSLTSSLAAVVTSATDSSRSLIVKTHDLYSFVELVQAYTKTMQTQYPVTTINSRVITLVDVTIDSLSVAGGRTFGGGGGVVTQLETVVSGVTSKYLTTIQTTRTGVVTAHPYETLLPVTMTLDGAIIVVTKKTTVTPLNNWGTRWDSLVWIDTTYLLSPPPFTYSGQETALVETLSSNGVGGNRSAALLLAVLLISGLVMFLLAL